MDRSGLPWRMIKSLRPVFFAGAAAAAWLTFSAPAATADTASDQGSLLGGISSVASTATSATDTLAGASTSVVQAAQPITAAMLPAPVAPARVPVVSVPVPAVSVPVPVVAVPSVPLPATPVTTAPAPAAPSPTGLVQPVRGGVTDVVDDVIAAVPVVNQVVPEGPVASVTAPVVSAAETAVTDAVVPDAAGALPVVDQVIEPVRDIVDVDVDAPLPLPLAPLSSAPADPLDGTSEPSASLKPAADTAGFPAIGSASAEGLQAGQEGPLTPAATLLTAPGGGAALPLNAAAVSSGTPELPAGGESPASGWLPAAAGSGSGSGSSSSGSSGGAAAWLTASTIDLPLTGDAPVSGPLQHAPAPVSLEPGCSPD
jgi:hypothetical protein